MRLIDADALFKEEREEYRNNAENISTDYKHIFAEIDDMPTVCDIEQMIIEITQIDDRNGWIPIDEVLDIILKYTKGE